MFADCIKLSVNCSLSSNRSYDTKAGTNKYLKTDVSNYVRLLSFLHHQSHNVCKQLRRGFQGVLAIQMLAGCTSGISSALIG